MSQTLISTEIVTMLKFSNQIEADEQIFLPGAAIKGIVGIPILRKGKTHLVLEIDK